MIANFTQVQTVNAFSNFGAVFVGVFKPVLISQKVDFLHDLLSLFDALPVLRFGAFVGNIDEELISQLLLPLAPLHLVQLKTDGNAYLIRLSMQSKIHHVKKA